jgi:Lrp/AsnC family leucine-responsive transcriptional regulator
MHLIIRVVHVFLFRTFSALSLAKIFRCFSFLLNSRVHFSILLYLNFVNKAAYASLKLVFYLNLAKFFYMTRESIRFCTGLNSSKFIYGMDAFCFSVRDKLGDIVKVDEIDKKILGLLILDARTRLKVIAKECGIYSVSVLNRLKRLKTLGVITGATLFPNLNALGVQVVATIGIETDSNEDEIIKFFSDHTDLIEPSKSVGKYDLAASVYAESLAELDKLVYEVRKRFGVKVTVNVWSGRPLMLYENLDLQPWKGEANGKS